LRIEDTDRARLVEGAEENIVETLRTFGLDFDEGPSRQSEHLGRYKECAAELIQKGVAYEDAGAARFKMPKDGVTKFTDIIHGEIQIENKTQEDFIILKSDGFPTYNLAHLVDDHDMKITHVIRGDEFISSMPKYIALHKAFGWDIPQYAHLPLLLNKERAKLSKREGEVAVYDFLDKGYLKEAVLNFVALLGWHPSKSDKELFTLEELITEFKLEDVQKAGAIFDTTKLDWMNGEYIKKKSPRELLELASACIGDFIQDKPQNVLEKVIALEQPRLKKLSEIGERVDYFFHEPQYDKELLRWKNMNDEKLKESLEISQTLLSEVREKEFMAKKIEECFRFDRRAGEFTLIEYNVAKTGDEKSFKESGIKKYDLGLMLWPLRVALTGKKASPGPFEIAEILGKEETLRRIQRALQLL